MYAVRLHAFGPAGNLVYEEVADPEPGPGQVRVAVRAAGVHLVDTVLRAGKYGGGPIPVPDLPTIPGREVAGIVDAAGPETDPALVGRRVVAHLGMAPGGYAELAVRDAAAIHEIPDGLGFGEAVAMIGTGRTTMGILDVAEIRADDVVLVTAAAGGVGALLVQAAVRAGATVVGLAGGAAKTHRVLGLGAAHAVDYTAPGWPEAVRAALGDQEVTLALDGVGGDLGRQTLELLGVGGRLVLFGWADAAGGPTRLTTEDLYARGITAAVAVGPRVLKRPGGLRGLEERALAAAASGALTPLVQSFPLKDAAAAHTALETRATVGKVVLAP
ncbi:oxidoreductase [Microbispora triticiradicis]|uniref:Oxidoreductase n=1 Tax=Microbispora triticiradicis TaxID=2200763 RepID=A0ABX9LSH5_9ACTN|nr:zinc-binding dehydrogenase [Microbispora triticiradicis]RGA06860.1 oxidoreductase [Microbispora triticiradicis]GLW23431.1 oxidoreductase [Microbispora amethystogenes]